MAKVLRLDLSSSGSLGTPKRLRGGGLRVDSHFTKPGVFPYFDETLGKTVMEYRPSTEVFAPASIESWKGVPLTDGHPADLVTDETWKEHAIGHLGDDVRQDGDKLAASHVVQHADAVSRLVAKTRKGLSGGYWADVDETPGVTKGDPHVPDGISYHRVQRNIEGNHVAHLRETTDARLGTDMTMRLDASGHGYVPAEVVERFFPRGETVRVLRMDSKEPITMEITLFGKTYNLESEADRKSLKRDAADHEKARTDAADASAAVAKERDELKGRLDAATAQVAALPVEIAKGVKARVALEADAHAVLGADTDLAGKTDDEIKKARRDGIEAAIKKAKPELKLEGRTDDELRGLFEGFGLAPTQEERADAGEQHVSELRRDAHVVTTTKPIRRGSLLSLAESGFRAESEKASTAKAQS